MNSWIEVERHGQLITERYYVRDGLRYVQAAHGQRYAIVVQNDTLRRIEAVLSVDGLDIHNGQPASYAHHGMVIRPNTTARFEGWRTSLEQVATFRFGEVAESYATLQGTPANVGVIGVALFQEYQAPTLPYDPWKFTWRSGVSGQSVSSEMPMASGQLMNASEGTSKNLSTSRSLGTAFGEQRDSQVRTTTFQRASTQPYQVVTFYYKTHEELAAMGFFTEQAQPFPGSAPQFCQAPVR